MSTIFSCLLVKINVLFVFLETGHLFVNNLKGQSIRAAHCRFLGGIVLLIIMEVNPKTIYISQNKKRQARLLKYAISEKQFLFIYLNDAYDLSHIIYSCPMKTNHSPDAHSCRLSKAAQKCVIYIIFFRTNAMFSHTNLLTHEVTSSSKLH